MDGVLSRDTDDEKAYPDVLWQDGDRRFCISRFVAANGAAQKRILVQTASPTSASTARLTHEFALRDCLDSTWALRPLELMQQHGETTLALDYYEGTPLLCSDGRPMELSRFLRLGVALL